MTARRVPASRGPARPQRAQKEKDIDSDLRQARASRKADAQQKHRLRRQEWETDDGDDDDGPALLGGGGPDDRDADDERGDEDDERP